jgi:hypothetical protein
MRRSTFLFFKGLGLLFAVLCGIGTAVLGWYDAADWMNIITYSLAVTGLILWGWYHFSIRWIDSDLKQNIFSQFPKKEQVEGKDLPEEEHINGSCWSIHNRPKKCVYWYFRLNWIVYNGSTYHTWFPFAS